MAVEIEGRTLPKRWKYNWPEKMNGGYWELKRGTDFEDLERARQAAIMYAARHKIMLSTSKVDDDTLGVIATETREEGHES